MSLVTVCFFQFAGSVQVMPCSSHFTVWPLAMAAVCAAVGFGCSTESVPLFELLLDEEDEFEFEELDFLNFSLRLQAATTNTSATIRETFFIGSPKAAQIRRANAFYRNRAQVSNEFARIQFRVRVVFLKNPAAW